ncbi:helix-turn-helix transcriptional regulator [uncultured Thermus sp.]|uniref:helix-turn-helix transcriptional regulator n=1 Tax=uncultured Thermus sp. TaxID=157149 RepID=UPI00262C43A4|nr:helix-turn-helix transcriptional regulator [uncultured Thermus sp.]
MDRFLLEVLGSVLEPLALIGRGRRILYATPSFQRLVHLREEDPLCLEALQPAFSSDRTPCCWDLASCYQTGEVGIWLTQDLSQALLCHAHIVGLDGFASFLLLRVEPLATEPAPETLPPWSFPNRRLFRNLRQNLGQEGYQRYVASLLKRIYALEEVGWLEPREGGGLASLVQKVREAMVAPLPFDLVYNGKYYHVFPGSHPEGPFLLVRGLRNVGARELLGLLWAADGGSKDREDPGQGSMDPGGLGALNSLTQREWQILALVAEGSDNKKIAATLGISLNTVKNHIKSLLAKTQSRRRTELVRRYLQALADPLLPGPHAKNPTRARGRRPRSKPS